MDNYCDVLLVNANFDVQKAIEPLGICCLASILRQLGFSVELVEPAVDGWSVEHTAECVTRRNPRVVGISIIGDNCIDAVMAFCRSLRTQSNTSRPFVCIGGRGPSLGIIAKKTKYMKLLQEIDAAVIGEADKSFPILVEALLTNIAWRKIPGLAYLYGDNQIIINPPPEKIANMDDLPFMARDIYKQLLAKYGTPLPASLYIARGCSYARCNYCGVSAFERLQKGPICRRRSSSNVVSEIIQLHKEFGVSEFTFEDDETIPRGETGKELIRKICKEIRELSFQISFSIFCRPDTVDYDTFYHLKNVGLKQIYLGVESIFNDDLIFFSKGIDSQDILTALKILMSLGYSTAVGSDMRIFLGYITWHPLSNFEQLYATAQFIKEFNLPPKLLQRRLMLYNGASIIDNLKHLNLIDDSQSMTWHYRFPIMEELEKSTVGYIDSINKKIREALRKIEKYLVRYPDKGVPFHSKMLTDCKKHRIFLDDLCIDYFCHLLEKTCMLGKTAAKDDVRITIERLNCASYDRLKQYRQESGIDNLINESFSRLGLSECSIDSERW